jgi:GT2 family glycosyltransferase
VNGPKVAIIILNWNDWKDTIECLESVFRNSYPNYQVVVIDNGSTNGSMEKIKTWADGKQEVLTPEPSHPLYYLSHSPVQKPIPYIEYDRKTAGTRDKIFWTRKNYCVINCQKVFLIQ